VFGQATVAVISAIFHVMAAHQPYQDLGADYFIRRHARARRARRMLQPRVRRSRNDLRTLGWSILETSNGVVCTPPEAA